MELRPLIATGWSMALGERAALAGLVAELRPQVSVELGTATGGSLRAIAAHSGEVHTFDFEPRVSFEVPNAVFHAGDYRELLPKTLAELAANGRNVDFVLVDGDHTAAGVRQDLQDLLASPALGQTVIALHDTRNDSVRAGIESLALAERNDVVFVDLDFVSTGPVTVMREMWGGLGLVVVDSTGELSAGEFKHFGVGSGARRPRSAQARAVAAAAPLRRSVRVARAAGATVRRRLSSAIGADR